METGNKSKTCFINSEMIEKIGIGIPVNENHASFDTN